MTTTEWRRNKDLVAQTAAVINGPLMAELFRTVEMVSLMPPQVIGSSPDDKALMLGQILGYRACLSVIRSMAVPLTAQQEIESTFEPQE
jgi:hypothetical protein